MGGVGRLACQGFLFREACVSVLVCETGFLLWSAMECPVMSFEMGLCVMCDFGQPVCWRSGLCSCVGWRIYVVCLTLKLTGSWVVVGFSVGMEAFGWSLIT